MAARDARSFQVRRLTKFAGFVGTWPRRKDLVESKSGQAITGRGVRTAQERRKRVWAAASRSCRASCNSHLIGHSLCADRQRAQILLNVVFVCQSQSRESQGRG